MSWRERGAHEADRLERLVSLSRRLATDANLPAALRSLLDSAIALTGAERGFFLLRRDGLLTCEAAVPELPSIPGPLPPYLSRSVLSRALEGNEGVLSTDVAADARFRARASVRRLGLRSVLAVPLQCRAGTTGVLYLDSRVGRTIFRPEDRDLLAAFAGQAALALEHSLLSSEARPLPADPDSQRSTAAAPEAPGTSASPSPGPPAPAGVPASAGGPRWSGALAPSGEGSPSRAFSPSRGGSPLRAPTPSRTTPANEANPERAPDAGSTIIGSSTGVLRVLSMVERIAPTELAVLIVGESGTGKELIARAIHDASPRARGPFLAENCAAIPDTLLESEMFGSVRGAFTGAERDREGLFRAAHGGTLFLDEVGEMALPSQARLLRALQERAVRPVGSPRSVPVDVRVVSAMNRDPAAAIASRRLRLDLYYRIAGMTLEVPPLRERREDIPPLIAHFLARLGRARPGSPRSLSSEALERLASHDWPGNVRELENEIGRAAALAHGERIEARDLSPRLLGVAGTPPRAHPAERTMIEAALVGAAGNVTAAAAAIGWSRQKLYRRMTRLAIPPSFGRPTLRDR